MERSYPWVLALLASLAWLHFAPGLPADDKEFLGAAIGVGAILTGFIATAKAILAALPSDSVMGRLRSSGYIDDLITYLAEALYGCLLFSVFGLAGFFIIKQPYFGTWFASAWIFLGVFSLAAFFRVSQVLLKVIRFTPTL